MPAPIPQPVDILNDAVRTTAPPEPILRASALAHLEAARDIAYDSDEDALCIAIIRAEDAVCELHRDRRRTHAGGFAQPAADGQN